MAQFLPGCLLLLKYTAPRYRVPGLLVLPLMLLLLIGGSAGIAVVQLLTAPYLRDMTLNLPTASCYLLLTLLLIGLMILCTEESPSSLAYVALNISACVLFLAVIHKAFTPLMPNRTLLISVCYYLIVQTVWLNAIVFISNRLVLPFLEIEIPSLKKFCWLLPAALCLLLILMLHLCVPHNASDCRVMLCIVFVVMLFYLLILRLILQITAELTSIRQLIVHAKQAEDFYVNLTRSVQQSRTYRHDIRHHFTMIRQMNRDGLSDKIDSYLTQYLDTIPSEPTDHYTGNYYIDALIYHFFRLAQNEGIQTYLQLNLPSVLRVAPYDLCTIFGNCLENALDACRQQRSGRRFIRVQGEMINQKIILIFSNSFNGHILMSEHLLSTKPGSGHGYGVQSVEFSASRYGGQVKIDYAEHVFRISVVLNQPAPTPEM